MSAGLRKHGHNLVITSDIAAKADIHIVSGPHYAKWYWKDHPRVILLDKRLYKEGSKPDTMASDPFVSLGWMNKGGGRDFCEGHGKTIPKIKENHGKGTIFLGDYNGVLEKADTVRHHPGNRRSPEPLLNALRRHKAAIGYRTTALITAALEGLDIDCRDSENILSRPNWRELLPYADWHFSEIQSGEAWDHLLQSQPQQ